MDRQVHRLNADSAFGDGFHFRMALFTDSIALVGSIALRIAVGNADIAVMSGHFSRHCFTMVGYFSPHDSVAPLFRLGPADDG